MLRSNVSCFGWLLRHFLVGLLGLYFASSLRLYFVVNTCKYQKERTNKAMKIGDYWIVWIYEVETDSAINERDPF